MKMDFQFGCERAIGLEGKIVLFARQMLEQCLSVKLHHVAHLGGEHIFGALRSRLPDQAHPLFETRPRQKSGAHLHHGGGKTAVGTHELACSLPNSASSWPARSSA